jgi:hypothetical protein
MAGSLVYGTAGAGAIVGTLDELTGAPPWPVVVGRLPALVLEGSLKAYANAERIIAAPTINPMKVPIRTLSGSRY